MAGGYTMRCGIVVVFLLSVALAVANAGPASPLGSIRKRVRRHRTTHVAGSLDAAHDSGHDSLLSTHSSVGVTQHNGVLPFIVKWSNKPLRIPLHPGVKAAGIKATVSAMVGIPAAKLALTDKDAKAIADNTVVTIVQDSEITVSVTDNTQPTNSATKVKLIGYPTINVAATTVVATLRAEIATALGGLNSATDFLIWRCAANNAKCVVVFDAGAVTHAELDGSIIQVTFWSPSTVTKADYDLLENTKQQTFGAPPPAYTGKNFYDPFMPGVERNTAAIASALHRAVHKDMATSGPYVKYLAAVKVLSDQLGIDEVGFEALLRKRAYVVIAPNNGKAPGELVPYTVMKGYWTTATAADKKISDKEREAANAGIANTIPLLIEESGKQTVTRLEIVGSEKLALDSRAMAAFAAKAKKKIDDGVWTANLKLIIAAQLAVVQSLMKIVTDTAGLPDLPVQLTTDDSGAMFTPNIKMKAGAFSFLPIHLRTDNEYSVDGLMTLVHETSHFQQMLFALQYYEEVVAPVNNKDAFYEIDMATPQQKSNGKKAMTGVSDYMKTRVGQLRELAVAMKAYRALPIAKLVWAHPLGGYRLHQCFVLKGYFWAISKYPTGDQEPLIKRYNPGMGDLSTINLAPVGLNRFQNIEILRRFYDIWSPKRKALAVGSHTADDLLKYDPPIALDRSKIPTGDGLLLPACDQTLLDSLKSDKTMIKRWKTDTLDSTKVKTFEKAIENGVELTDQEWCKIHKYEQSFVAYMHYSFEENNAYSIERHFEYELRQLNVMPGVAEPWEYRRSKYFFYHMDAVHNNVKLATGLPEEVANLVDGFAQK